jgi:hypothetical protein
MKTGREAPTDRRVSRLKPNHALQPTAPLRYAFDVNLS